MALFNVAEGPIAGVVLHYREQAVWAKERSLDDLTQSDIVLNTA
jgi:hypothetical protein